MDFSAELGVSLDGSRGCCAIGSLGPLQLMYSITASLSYV